MSKVTQYSEMHHFADTNLLYSCMISYIFHNLNLIVHWLGPNRISLNTDKAKFSKMRHIFAKMLQIIVSLKYDHLV